MKPPRSVRRARAFRTIWRVNALIILAIGIAGLGGICFGIGAAILSSYSYRQRDDVALNALAVPGVKTEWSLGGFTPVGGTAWRMAPVQSGSQIGGKREYSYDSYSDSTRNFLFLNITDKSTHWLLPDNHALVLDSECIGQDKAKASHPVRWITYRVVARDSNKDGHLSRQDSFDIGFTDAAGQGYFAPLQGVTDVQGSEMRGPDQRIVFYKKDGRQWVSEIDLAARRVTITRALPALN